MEEMIYQEDEELVKIAMEIVIQSGDARNEAAKALDYLERFDFEAAKNAIEQANQHILKAHIAQTETIQSEISGQKTIKPSLLFNHAQDTLMTVMSEIHLTEKLIHVFESFYKNMKGQDI